MTTIEYKDIRISAPDKWADLTLGEYEALNLIKPRDLRERVTLIAEICKTDVDTLYSCPAELFNTLVNVTAFLFEDPIIEPSSFFKIDGERYIVSIDDKLTLAEWVDVDEAQKEGGAGMISKILAVVARPAGEAYDWNLTKDRASLFAAQPVDKILPVLAFFLQCKIAYDQRLTAYSRIEQALDQLAPSIRRFVAAGAGTKLYRISRGAIFYSLTGLLRYRWSRFLRSYNSVQSKPRRTRHREN